MIDENRRSRINTRLIELRNKKRMSYLDAMHYIKRTCRKGSLTNFHLTASEEQIAELERIINDG